VVIGFTWYLTSMLSPRPRPSTAEAQSAPAKTIAVWPVQLTSGRLAARAGVATATTPSNEATMATPYRISRERSFMVYLLVS
jgi:hypothetical protein